ncbi:hypothetical protein LSH36_278g00026 [Paralvinella palmiformis]|uniref:Uncharacterized protein n=1 Tax=Paralvinella palmiformis TaxID=53620 RepID=A0AAD9JIX2_9ANNE|nr:hypothetical protein LSH36_278g00026 [Paralvinella palmiformis]
MTDSYLGTPPAIPDELPPSYEQALDHRRLETSDVPPGYSPREATGHSRLVHASNVNTNRTYQLPRIDLTRGRSPEVVSEYDSVSTTLSSEEQMSNCLKLALPPMHMCIAITCLVINILLPGLGECVS